VLSLLERVVHRTGAALILISHDIAVVSEIASRVFVMYAGKVVEELPVSALASGPAHPYTHALVASIPDMSTDRSQPLASIPGRPPHASELPEGCAFAPRCPLADDGCRTVTPSLEPSAEGGRVACWHPLDAGSLGPQQEAVEPGGPDSVPSPPVDHGAARGKG
jgi:oligopeptide/dipeptide ABC transporter ATP-binding protein